MKSEKHHKIHPIYRLTCDDTIEIPKNMHKALNEIDDYGAETKTIEGTTCHYCMPSTPSQIGDAVFKYREVEIDKDEIIEKLNSNFEETLHEVLNKYGNVGITRDAEGGKIMDVSVEECLGIEKIRKSWTNWGKTDRQELGFLWSIYTYGSLWCEFSHGLRKELGAIIID